MALGLGPRRMEALEKFQPHAPPLDTRMTPGSHHRAMERARGVQVGTERQGPSLAWSLCKSRSGGHGARRKSGGQKAVGHFGKVRVCGCGVRGRGAAEDSDPGEGRRRPRDRGRDRDYTGWKERSGSLKKVLCLAGVSACPLFTCLSICSSIHLSIYSSIYP